MSEPRFNKVAGIKETPTQGASETYNRSNPSEFFS